MTGLIEWDERFSVGIEEIDSQHKELFRIIDTVFEGISHDDDRELLGQAFDKVLDYTRYHFETEEGYFEKFDYPDAKEHKAQHAKLIEEVLALKEKYAESTFGISLELADFLTQWLQTHILLHDKRYAPFIGKELS